MLAILTTKTVFHLKGLPFIKTANVSLKTTIVILGMHALNPITQFFLHGSSGEIEPPFVEVSTLLIRPSNPDHDRRSIRHVSEAFLTFPQGLLGGYPLRDVA